MTGVTVASNRPFFRMQQTWSRAELERKLENIGNLVAPEKTTRNGVTPRAANRGGSRKSRRGELTSVAQFPNDPRSVYRAEWEGDPALQSSFPERSTYVLFRATGGRATSAVRQNNPGKSQSK